MELAAYEGSDGYISDVPNNHEYAQSDVSNDFVESSKTLERHFQDKYRMLRQAYEDRILRLSTVVEETCAKLFTDELLNELKNDKTSAAFIPAHLSEVISNHLQSENERNMHHLLQKISTLEMEKISAQNLVTDLRKQLSASKELLAEAKNADVSSLPVIQNIQGLEKHFREYVESGSEEVTVLKATIEQLRARDKQVNNKLEMVTFELAERDKKCEALKIQLNAKRRDIDTLEQSFEQSSRELAMIEGMEKQEQVLKREMKEQIRILTQQRNALHDENQQLRVSIQYASDELDRCHLIAQQKEVDDEMNKQKIADLMAQVESMLTQEANESNSAIASVHEKMKLFRQRMAAEISREKRLNSALQEELAAAKKARTESITEQQRLQEQVASLREQVERDRIDAQALQSQLHTEAEQVVALRVRLAEAQAHCSRTDHVMAEYERLKHAEASLLEQRAELKSEKDKAAEQSHLETRLEASRVHYENELAELRKQLKNAYAFDKNGKDAEPTTEASNRATIQSWVQENARLKQRHAAELSALANQLRGEYEGVVRQLQSRLEEAAGSLDRLKGMVRDGKSVIRTQSAQLDALRTEVNLLKQYSSFDHPSAAGRSNNTSRMSASSPARRSTMMTTLSPAQTAEAVRDHRNAIAFRASSAPRPSVASPVTSLPPPVAQGKSPGAARRSSTSVLGPDRSFTTQSPPVSARSSVDDYTLSQYQEEIGRHQRATQLAQDEIGVLKEQVNQLLEDAQRFRGTILDLESAKRRLSEKLQISREPRGNQDTENASTVVPWEASMNNSFLQAKIDEINTLREALSALKAQSAEEANRQKNTIELLRAEIDGLHTQNSNLSAANAQLERDIEEKMHTASSFRSEESFNSSPTRADAGNKTQELVLDRSADARRLQQSLQHQAESEISASELADERARVKELRHREIKLFQLLANVQKHYQSQIHLLRQNLMSIRASVQTIVPYTELEVRKTVDGLGNKLNAIFSHIQRKQSQELKSARIELSLAHTEEVNALEARFAQQIERQAAEHSVQLEQLHGELVRKAEDALGFNAYIDSVAVPVEDDIEEDELNVSTTSSRRSVSFARDTTGGVDRSHSSTSSKQRRSSAPAAPAAPTRRQSGVSAFSSSLKPSFESVLNGVIEALQAEDMLDSAGSQQLVSLAKAHQDPSFAAQAAAKSLLSGHLERFVNDLLNRSLSKFSKISSAAGKTVTDSSGGVGSSSGSAVTNREASSSQGYSSADYALFFDS